MPMQEHFQLFRNAIKETKSTRKPIQTHAAVTEQMIRVHSEFTMDRILSLTGNQHLHCADIFAD